MSLLKRREKEKSKRHKQLKSRQEQWFGIILKRQKNVKKTCKKETINLFNTFQTWQIFWWHFPTEIALVLYKTFTYIFYLTTFFSNPYDIRPDVSIVLSPPTMWKSIVVYR